MRRNKMNEILKFITRPSRFLKPGRSLLLLMLLCFQPLAFANLNTGLVAYYPFNGNANDERGNSNHGSENGGLIYVNGINNSSDSF
jgi:hypothetical protein